MKHQVYKTKINSIDHLKERIIEETQAIQGAHLLNSLENFKKRIHLCIQQNGDLFEHLM